MAEKKMSSTDISDLEQKENWQDNEKRDINQRFENQKSSLQNSTNECSYPRIEISVDAIKSNNLQNPQFLNNFSKNQSIEDITAFLVSNIEVYIETVSSHISKVLLTALLKLVAKACGGTDVSSKIYVLKSTLQKKFAKAICSFLLKINDRKNLKFWENFGGILSDILIILENSMQYVPNSWKYLRSIINAITSTLPDIQQNKDIPLPEDCEKKIAKLRESIQEIEANLKELSESDVEENDDLCEINDKSDQSEPEDDTLNNNKVVSKKELFKENSKNRISTIQRSNAINRHIVLNPKLEEHESSVKSYNFQNPDFLNDISNRQTAEEITVFLMSDMKVYTQILSSDISEEPLIAILNLIAKSCEITFATNKSYVLKSALQKKFGNRICSFLSGLVVDDTKDDQFWRNFGDVLNNILIILENAMQLIPMTTWEYLRTIVKTITLVLPVLQQSKKIKLPVNFDSKMASLKDDIKNIKMKFEKVSKPTIVQNIDQCQDGDVSDQNEPDDDYRFIDVFPKIEELINPDRPFLRKNIIKGKYTSLQHYLDVHFRLMREDFINPIREDICDYLNNIKRKLFNIKVHEKVSFINKNVEKNLVGFRIKVEVSQSLQNYIHTGQNKRFMHGTLLFFSTDRFQSMFCGRVVGSDELENGILLVNLPKGNYIDYKKDYLMIECIVFFEPYYQVLNALRRLSYQQFPMENYLLQLDSNILPPKYMKKVTNLKIPANLNSSQKNALTAALNKELVIIQGPPGTGKTFLGRTMVQILLEHGKHWKDAGPMLVLCYTNHALDQFLGDLYKFTDKIVRLGGKSSNLLEVNKKFGPEGLLKSYLEKRYGIYVDDEDNDVKHDFNLLVRGIRNCNLECNFLSRSFYGVVGCSVPGNITRWLIEKAELSSTFKNIKWIEDYIYEVHEKLLQIFEEEKDGILANIICEWDFQKFKMSEYRFQNFELFCWLLCDDGTISLKQNKNVENYFGNDIVEQDKIYNLLFDFILGDIETTGYTDYYFSVSRLESIAAEISNYLKIETNKMERRYLKEQYDFLLNKIEYLKLCLKTDVGHPEVEFENYPDPFAIPSKHRWQLYKHWLELYKMGLKITLDEHYEKYQFIYNIYNDLKEEENIRLFKTMDIIGMTTTCAARLRSTLEKLSSPIVIVEEAAEVLESHIITSLTKDCQHLILLGDHQQLRPTTSDYTIEKKYNLGISLFERMVLNNIECHTLNVQHRMRPEISGLISPLFYKELFNHPSVEMYPLVSGIGSPLYFIDHTEPEEPYLESSKMNMHEAKFLIELAIYLLNNNYEPTDITILAAYLGQSYVLQQEQKKSSHIGLQQVRIAVVDNFQGEENKIILLSLVRNNNDKKVGFLSTDNRVCVALSRAKEGLYIMGNMTHLCEASDIWKSIRATLEAQQAIGTYLPLHCKNHKDHITLVSKPNDFTKVPEGGCTQSCDALLECGHNCIKICHSYDVDHKLYKCMKSCLRLLCDDPNHKCKKICFEKCGRCHYPVSRKLNCGHEKTLPCATNINYYKCLEIVETQLKCGHQQNIPCHTRDSHKCLELVEFTHQCGHTQDIPCYKKSESIKVSNESNSDTQTHTKSELTKGSNDSESNTLDTYNYSELDDMFPLDWGHIQNISYSELTKELNQTETDAHETFCCKVLIEKRIPKCGHYQMIPCSEDLTAFKCQVVTEITLKCGHKQEKLCSREEKEVTCSNDCGQTLHCGHTCPKKCHGNDDIGFHRRYKCMEPCNKNLKGCRNPEKHQKCTLPCFEDCEPCTEIVINSSDSCSHTGMTKCYASNTTCHRPCSKKLSCGHFCKNKCYEPCSTCVQKTFKKIPDCGHKIEVRCYENPLQQNCKKPCTQILDCGHNCTKKCNEPCTTNCNKRCQKLLECGHKCINNCRKNCACKIEVSPHCGHSIRIKCGDVIIADQCEIVCKKVLNCGHRQFTKCNEAIENLRCFEKCGKILESGHPCKEKCGAPCTPLDKCKQLCNKTLNCKHPCKKMCNETCTDKCSEQCTKEFKCGHKCTNPCSLECITVCNSKCDKKFDCGHKCRKLCTEPCPEVCKICLLLGRL